MKVLIIAEVGINHNGKLNRAYQLIDTAKRAGADVVKFQIFIPELLATHYAKKSSYQKNFTKDKERQIQMLKKFALTFEEHKMLYLYSQKKNIKYCASPFDLESSLFLLNIGTKIIKIASGEINNYPLLKQLSNFKGQLILSTGMSTLKEVEKAVDLIVKNGFIKKNLSLLYCCSSYPSPIKDIDLEIIKKLKHTFKLNVGFSDHSNLIEAPIAAVSSGAKIIEKHLTLNKNDVGPDHRSSLDGKQFSEMVRSIRIVEKLYGNGQKNIKPSEKVNRKNVRKSIVAKENILKGDRFSTENLTTKRPGNGLSPMKWEHIIGKKAKKYFKKDEQIKV